jgi:heme/copper-type cytochrome/quinol oxidase subunit 2
MPIAVHVVSEQAYNAWLDQAKKKYAQGLPPTPVAEIEKSLKNVVASADAR